MKHSRLKLMGLLLAVALGLAACGAAPATGWPGVALSGDVAIIANGPQIYGFNTTTNQPWMFPLTADNITGPFYVEPGVSDEVIVVGSEGPAGSYSGLLYGLNLDGTQKWCAAFDAAGAQRSGCKNVDGAVVGGLLSFATRIDNRVASGIALTDGVAYLGLASGQVFAIQASGDAAGNKVWNFKANHAVWATPLVTADTVYVVSLDHHIYALNRATGEPRWQKDLGAAIAGTPALEQGLLYVGAFDKTLHVLDANSGDEQWTFAATNWVWGGPIIQDGIVYFADISGTIYAVDIASHAQIWAVKHGGVVRASPLLTADRLYVGDYDGRLLALRLSDGALAWTSADLVKMRGHLLTSPLLLNDNILVTPHLGDNLIAGFTTDGGPTSLAWKPSK